MARMILGGRSANDTPKTTQVPELWGVVSSRCTQSPPPEVLFECRLSQGQQGGESAPVGIEAGEPRLLPRPGAL
ncbi:MAG: hypothetical protein ACREX4_21465 [Gammaproteobacteria bacterium]